MEETEGQEAKHVRRLDRPETGWKGECRVQRLLREKTEAIALLVCVASVALLVAVRSPKGLPLGILATGAVAGTTIVLNALGIVIVYRATKIVNFAQLWIGLVTGAVFLQLSHRRTFISGLSSICPACVPKPQTYGELIDRGAVSIETISGAGGSTLTPEQLARIRSLRLDDPRFLERLPEGLDIDRIISTFGAPSWMVQVNYWLSVLAAIAVGVALVWLVYTFIIKRFSSAPRLVLTVATLGAGIATDRIGGLVLDVLFGNEDSVAYSAGSNPVPIDMSYGGLPPAVFNATDIVSVIVALGAGAALFLFFRRSRTGVVLRAVAENPARARTLGVNVERVTSRAWLIAGALSSTAAFLASADSGAVSAEYGQMVRTLAAAVVGGLVGLPLAVLGGIGIGVLDQAVLWGTNSQGAVDGILLVLVVVVLLAQRARASRADHEANASWLASRELRPIPRELRGLPPVRNTIITLAVIGAVFVLGYPWFMSPSQVNLAAVNMLFAMIGLSLLVLTGWAGQISLAQMAFAGIGAYVTARLGAPFPIPVLTGALAGALAAVAVGVPALRLRGLHLAITTLALSLATVSILLEPRYLGRYLPDAVERPQFLGIDFGDDRAFYYLVLVLLAGMIVMTMGLRRSRTARVLIAAKDNEPAAQSFSINLLLSRLTAFAISGAMAGFAGGLYAYSQHGVKVESFDPEQSIKLFLMAIVGGLGSIAGPVLGALYLGLGSILGESPLRALSSYLFDPGIGLLLLLLLLPGGLVQGVWNLRDAWLRRIASRYRIHVPSLVADGRDGGTLPIVAKTRPSGGTLFIPSRYRLERQWMVDAEREKVTSG